MQEIKFMNPTIKIICDINYITANTELLILSLPYNTQV